ncbi:MAG: hypothetical protein RLZ92_616 [Pseudomonadota bacterium]|jgi:hypothetical protein
MTSITFITLKFVEKLEQASAIAEAQKMPFLKP